MRTNAKKSIGWTIVLMLFGVIALYGGEKWLVVLIPAAMLVWYGTDPNTAEWPELTERVRIEVCR